MEKRLSIFTPGRLMRCSRGYLRRKDLVSVNIGDWAPWRQSLLKCCKIFASRQFLPCLSRNWKNFPTPAILALRACRTQRACADGNEKNNSTCGGWEHCLERRLYGPAGAAGAGAPNGGDSLLVALCGSRYAELRRTAQPASLDPIALAVLFEGSSAKCLLADGVSFPRSW